MQHDKRILVIGNGWLGQWMAREWGADILTERLSPSNAFLNEIVEPYDVVVNCVAKTSIDWCEGNREEAMEVNALLAGALAAACAAEEVKFVHISSACIFESSDETDVKFEDSQPNPQCYYALTKWVGEEMVAYSHPEALIVRIRLPISEYPHPRNTIGKVLTYNRLVDTRESVTIVEDALPLIKNLIDTAQTGTHHVVNAGTITMPEIAKRFGHEFTTISRGELRDMTRKAGKASRVSTIVGTRHWHRLPNVHDRIGSLVYNYKKHLCGS